MFTQMDKQGHIDLPKDEWVSSKESNDYCSRVFPSVSLTTLLAQKCIFLSGLPGCQWALPVDFFIFLFYYLLEEERMLEIPPTFNSILYFKLWPQHTMLSEVCKRLMHTLGKHILWHILYTGLWPTEKKKRYNLTPLFFWLRQCWGTDCMRRKEENS